MVKRVPGWCHDPLGPSVSGCRVVVVLLKMALLLRARGSRHRGGAVGEQCDRDTGTRRHICNEGVNGVLGNKRICCR